MHRARNRRSCQRENVHRLFKLLDFLLVPHAEAVLLVNNEKPKVIKFNRFGEKAVCPDDDVNGATCKPGFYLFYLLRGSETAENLHLNRKLIETFFKSVVVLKREDCRWHKHCHLLFSHHRFERGAQSHLRFTVPHIATDESIHGTFGFHVCRHVFNGTELVFGFLIRKECLKFCLPRHFSRKIKSLACLPSGI